MTGIYDPNNSQDPAQPQHSRREVDFLEEYIVIHKHEYPLWIITAWPSYHGMPVWYLIRRYDLEDQKQCVDNPIPTCALAQLPNLWRHLSHGEDVPIPVLAWAQEHDPDYPKQIRKEVA